MNKFKRKSLYLALAAGIGAVGVAGSASAVHVNGNGLGQFLIYPYYTVRGGTDTYLSVVNTTNSTKAVKVRFTEGKNSREVLDFNLYLSPNDEWTGAIINTSTGAKLVTNDNSCTSPDITKGGANGVAFVNYAYSGTLAEGIQTSGGDGETASMDRTREGYFEIIEMGTITNPTIITAVTHVSGMPANCAVVQAAAMVMDSITGGVNQVGQLTGGLAGTASLLNVAAGTDVTFDPVALGNFNNALGGGIWNPPGSIRPDVRDAAPAISTVLKIGSNGPASSVVITDWAAASGIMGTPAVHAVSATLMHNNIINEFVLDTATVSQTDWVVTMPTKRFYVPVSDSSAVTNPAALSTAYNPFTTVFYTNGACEPVGLTYWDREEKSVASVGFSPQPVALTNCLPWESTVVTFNNGNLLKSSNSLNFPVNFQNGWARIAFTQTMNNLAAGTSQPATVHTYTGLPTVGFMVQDFVNGNVGGVLSNYGGNFIHKYTSGINDGSGFLSN